jgi:hypothetical protein
LFDSFRLQRLGEYFTRYEVICDGLLRGKEKIQKAMHLGFHRVFKAAVVATTTGGSSNRGCFLNARGGWCFPSLLRLRLLRK